jgi:diguanylate cyclase (GGDEF)-like protein
MTGSKRNEPSDAGPQPAGGDGSLMVVRATTCAAAALVLLVVPVYQLIDIFAGRTPWDLLWLHAAWRSPAFLAALVALAGCFLLPDKTALRHWLRVLAASVMVMMFGLFSVDVQHAQGDPEQMARGIIMATFAVSLLSLQGGREVLAYFAIPFIGSTAWLAWRGADMLATTALLTDPLMMLVIAMIASQLFYRIRQQQFALQRRLNELARTDALTGLHNRRELEQRIAEEMSRSRRHARPLSVVIGDLDHFKRVNDEYGHAVGDDVLRAVGERMRGSLRAEDLAVRWGGEEFLLLLPDTDLENAVRVADKIRLTIADRPVICGDRSVGVTISFGVAQLGKDEAVADLVRRADDAMYRAKSEGRDRVCR